MHVACLFTPQLWPIPNYTVAWVTEEHECEQLAQSRYAADAVPLGLLQHATPNRNQ